MVAGPSWAMADGDVCVLDGNSRRPGRHLVDAFEPPVDTAAAGTLERAFDLSRVTCSTGSGTYAGARLGTTAVGNMSFMRRFLQNGRPGQSLATMTGSMYLAAQLTFSKRLVTDWTEPQHGDITGVGKGCESRVVALKGREHGARRGRTS